MKVIQKFIGPVILGLSVLGLLIMFLNYDSDPGKQSAATDIGLQVSAILMVLCIVGIVGGFILTAITNPASILRTGIGVIFILVLWGISYGIAGNEVTKVYEEFKVDAGMSKMIGSFLLLTSTLGILTVLGIVVTEIMGSLR